MENKNLMNFREPCQVPIAGMFPGHVPEVTKLKQDIMIIWLSTVEKWMMKLMIII